MRGTYSFSKRLLAMVICIAMVAAYLPGMALTTSAETVGNRIADPHTLDQWKQYFGVLEDNANNVSLTTEFAGAVWTDKSVFDPSNTLPTQLTGAKYNGNSFSITDEGDNFLVSLSTIASNKEIVGYSTIPTDTVFVLDLSSSMQSNDDQGGSAIDELVLATNKAITDLLALNKNNRVAVVLFAGNTSGAFNSNPGATNVLLPMDTYTAATAGTYLRSAASGGNADYAIEVASGVTGSNGAVSGRLDSARGTFTQDGIFEAMQVFLNVTDTKVAEGVQAGTTRLPIMVLMTDGEPTLANRNYDGTTATDLGNSEIYLKFNNQDYNHRDTIAWLTQLTAAYAKREISQHYENESGALFYTLAFGEESTRLEEALSVVNPASTSDALNGFWNDFLAGRSVNVYTYTEGGRTRYYTTSNDTSEPLTAEDKVYVDKFFEADSDQAMFDAFQDIVDEIVIQSKYYPTYVENDHDHDGYLTFVDKIGEYMEVTDVKGIIIGDRLFSGAALSQRFENGGFGTIDSPNTYGNNLVWSIMERLGIANKQTAQALLNDAYEHGQLAYENDQNFSHYIGWFAKEDANGNAEYVDFWHEGMTQEQIDKAVNEEGATHIIKSYGFLGDTTVVPGVSNTDMMYMTVRISTEISTGESIVVWQIPASLVPTTTYEVEVTVNSEGEITELNSLELESGTADSPIRLVYEVALQEDIHDWNLTQKVADSYKNSGENKAEGYVFYSNKWKEAAANTDAAKTAAAEDTSRNTYSHFEPSVQNERYYYTQDSVVLRKVGESYQVYTGSKPTGDSYYHSLQVYEKLENGHLRIHTHYEPISAEAMESVKADGSQWVIPKGVVHRYYDFEIAEKEQNPTGTMQHSDHPFVVWNAAAGHYYTYSTQGNNGMLTMTPATGIKLTKTLAEGYTSAEEFTFTVTGDLTDAILVTLDENGGEKQRIDLTSNQVTLSAGETVYIIGLTAGNYIVTENTTGKDYKVSSVKIDGANAGGTEAAVTLTNQDITEVEFTNAPKLPGTLSITKELDAAMGSSYLATAANKSFEMVVTTSAPDGVYDAVHSGDAQLQSVTVAGGSFTVNLKHNETVTVTGLPAGATATVVETPQPGFTASYLENAVAGDGTVTIPDGSGAVVVVTNSYAPSSVTLNLELSGTKTIIGKDAWTDSDSFTFVLQRWIDGQWRPVNTATANKDDKTLSFAESFEFDAIGEHTFQVIETNGGQTIDGMTYDATKHNFTVTVIDDEMDGQLKIASVVSDHSDVNHFVNQQGTNNWSNDHIDFTNRYQTSTVTAIDIQKALTNPSGSDRVDLSGYTFQLLDADSQVVGSAVTDAAGEAQILLTYDNSIFNGTNLVTYTYTLQEVDPGITGMTKASDVTVTVEVHYDNSVVSTTVEYSTPANADGEVVMTNVYDPGTANVTLQIEKVLEGRNPTTADSFVFEFTHEGQLAGTMTATYNGSQWVYTPDTELTESLIYTKVGGYRYEIREVNGGSIIDGVAYDSTVHYMNVTVTDNGGTLSADYILEDSADKVILFTNVYAVREGTQLVLRGTKELSGRPMLSGEFVFQLTEVNASGETVTDGLVLTAENDPDGNGNGVAVFTFEEISYDSVDVHYYKIEEAAGHALGVSYAKNAYILQVTVSDNGVGGLDADWQIVKTHTGAANADWVAVQNGGKNVVFENTYKPASVSILLDGIKDLLGRELVDGEFAFTITETANDFQTPVANGFFETVYNDAQGNVVFGANNQKLEFTTEDTHYYLIQEDASNALADITYDDTKYHVTVEVTDNHNGYLEAAVSVVKIATLGGAELPAQTVSSIVFENGYDPTRPIKTVDKQTVSLGEALTYTISYVNTTGAPADLVITDVLDPALRYVEGSAFGGVYSDGTITWAFEGVPAGETVTVSFQATVKVDTAATDVSNKAQIDVENVDSAIFTNEVVTQVEEPDLSIQKKQSVGTGTATTEKQTVVEGDVVTYILTVTNNGEGDAYGITVTDKVPEGLVYVDGSAGSGIYENGVITWTLHTLEAGDNVQLTFKVTVPAVEEDTVWTNVAAFVYTNNPDGPDEVTESNEVEIQEPAPEPVPSEPVPTEPPATEPPATEPPATEPPATEPPATEPPATEPPATEPPATEPPATEPPATEPPATEPPTTEPPATEPPATEPPAQTPVTGDGFQGSLFISLMVLSSFGLAAVLICKKREEAKETKQ